MSGSFRSRASRLRASVIVSAIGLATLAASGCTGMAADRTPIQAGIAPGARLFVGDAPVNGLRLSLYGVQDVVNGVDVGLVNDVQKSFKGLQVGLGNVTHGSTHGVQIGGANTSETSVTGVQAALSNQVGEDFEGVQFGLVNYVEKKTRAGQLGFFFNRAGEMKGAQFGILNVAESLDGVQFGLINVNSKGWLPICPLVNVGW